jgi:hypothetical protein
MNKGLMFLVGLIPTLGNIWANLIRYEHLEGMRVLIF